MHTRWFALTLGILALLPIHGVAQVPLRPLPPLPAWLPRYDLDIRLDVPGHKAHVHQVTTWTNRQERPAHEIVFNAHARYVTPAAEIGLLAKTLEILRMNPDEGIYTERPLQIHTIRLGKEELPFRFEGDTATDLVIPLPAPVTQGASITLEIDFIINLPQKQGRWGQWQGVTQLSNWVPMVAIYDNQGWHPTPFIPWHQPFFNETGIFRARVSLPADHKVATTGTVVSSRPLEQGLQEVVIEAPGVRDFAFLCSPRYVEFSAEAATLPGMPPVRVHIMAFPEHETNARLMLSVICKVMPLFSRWIGPYPWPDYTIAESYFGWNGNECATLVMIDERVLSMPTIGVGYIEYLLAHETCHQWWYNLIGTNGYCETWLDEAMATFWAHKYLDLEHGTNNRMLAFPSGLSWLPNIHRDAYRSIGYIGVRGRGEDGATLRPMPDFGHIGNLFGICYDKGSRVVGLIQERLGEAAFIDVMHRIYDRYSFKVLRVADLQRELEEYTGRSWEDFFQRWLKGKGLVDWSVEKVDIDHLDGPCRGGRWASSFCAALRIRRDVRCKVTVTIRQKGEFDEPTVLGFCLYGNDDDRLRTPYQVRVPIVPGAGVVTMDDPPARIEPQQDGSTRVEIELPCEPLQISLDPEGLLVDRNPTNNHWRTRLRWHFSPLYTMLDEAELTAAHDRWNVTAGPWLYGAAYADPWYQRAAVAGARVGLFRTQEFLGGAYVGYRPGFRDVVAGIDGTWDHWPWSRTQVGFSAEYRLAHLIEADSHPSRAAVFGRYVFQYNSSLYLPPIHYVEAFATVQENFLPLVRHVVPGADRFKAIGLGGVHYHLNYLTPYWDPQGGIAVDATYAGGIVGLERRLGAHQVYGQVSTVKGVPDLSSWTSGDCWPSQAASALLRYLGETRVAVRAAGAAGLPDRAQFFTLGGDMLHRALFPAERQGSLMWLGSVEWRFPIWKNVNYGVVDNIASARNLSGALFYDVGDVYSRGHSFGPIVHGLGAGLRLDVTWFGFVERASLRLDVAKAVNVDTPWQFNFGVNMPF